MSTAKRSTMRTHFDSISLSKIFKILIFINFAVLARTGKCSLVTVYTRCTSISLDVQYACPLCPYISTFSICRYFGKPKCANCGKVSLVPVLPANYQCCVPPDLDHRPSQVVIFSSTQIKIIISIQHTTQKILTREV